MKFLLKILCTYRVLCFFVLERVVKIQTFLDKCADGISGVIKTYCDQFNPDLFPALAWLFALTWRLLLIAAFLWPAAYLLHKAFIRFVEPNVGVRPLPFLRLITFFFIRVVRLSDGCELVLPIESLRRDIKVFDVIPIYTEKGQGQKPTVSVEFDHQRVALERELSVEVEGERYLIQMIKCKCY